MNGNGELKSWLKVIAALLAVLIVLQIASMVRGGDIALASADRQQFPAADWGYIFYLTTNQAAAAERESLGKAAAFVTASSSRQSVIERCTPTPIAPGLYRIDLRDFKWDWRKFHAALKTYPYAPWTKLPLVIRADWLVAQLSDTSRSQLYYDLLYGAAPKNLKEFQQFHKINTDTTLQLAHIEGKSGVALAESRWMEAHPTQHIGGIAWGTRDSAVITQKADPLEALDGSFKFDAGEWIAPLPKVSVETYARGNLQAYLLANAQGARQEFAPNDVVEDSKRFRGLASIRNWGSCVGCHTSGIIEPSENELKRYLQSGAVKLEKKKADAEEIERQHLGELKYLIVRQQEDYERGVKLTNGLTGEENAAAFNAAVNAYDAPVTLEIAARETYCTPAELKLALAYWSYRGYESTARLSELAHGQAMGRDRWEEEFYTAYTAVSYWRKSLKAKVQK